MTEVKTFFNEEIGVFRKSCLKTIGYSQTTYSSSYFNFTLSQFDHNTMHYLNEDKLYGYTRI
ncbi:hypothetical protein DGG96_16570 [Legionella qingyii]|uniref:Uncharacterized protein n=1 Tax=Legionella qingyii TaxID=2184757 RepID=A0A317U2G7_9GAMM|nr:hypothetical protein DGG96_16570 [Legionella qingyii]